MLKLWVSGKYATTLLQFKLISQAYETLSNPQMRLLYDCGGEEAVKRTGTEVSYSPFDIFDMFFGATGRGPGGSERGKDVVHQIKVSLEDFYSGATRKLSLKKKIICKKCDGMIFYCMSDYKYTVNSRYLDFDYLE